MAPKDGGKQARGWGSFARTAEEICRRTLKKDGCKEVKPSNWKNEKNQEEDEKTKIIMKERNKVRRWDLGWGNQTRVQIMGETNLVVNLLSGSPSWTPLFLE